MEIKTTDEEIARFTAMCVATALMGTGLDFTSDELINLKNALKSDIKRDYKDAILAFGEIINESFYTN